MAKRQTSKVIQIVVYLAALLSAGCSEDEWYSGIDEYHQRMSRLLDVDYQPIEWSIDATKYPIRRDLLLPEPKASIGLIDFLRLSQCELQRLVGDHNGSMARLQAASQQLFYQAEFIRLGDKCINDANDANDGSDVLTDLKAVVKNKRSAIPVYGWNASFGSVEFQKLYAPYGDANPALQKEMSAELQQAMWRLGEMHQRNKSGVLAKENKPVYEQALAVLSSSNYAGALLQQQKQWLSSMAHIAEQLDGVELCRLGGDGNGGKQQVLLSPKKREAYLYVFQNYYINEVQVTAARLAQQRNQWLELQQMLITDLAVPKSAEGYFNEWLKVGTLFDKQIAWHTKFWQQQLSRCDILPKV